MSVPVRFSGVLAPVVTPFNRDLTPNAELLIDHCHWLLSRKVGLAVFGTNSEANSLSVGEKVTLLDRLIDGGIDPGRLMPGTGCCALTDTVRLTKHAVSLGCRGVLMLPPFYYKDVTDAGLFRAYAEVIERVGSERLQIYLYHIPPVSGVGLSVNLVDELVARYPQTMAGIKDSSRDWENTRALLDRCWDEFRIFVGSEAFLLRNMRAGGAGCISATANINPGAIHRLYAEWQAAAAGVLQQELDAFRDLMQAYPMIPALKAVIAHYGRDTTWNTVRPPLLDLDEELRRDLVRRLGLRGFDMSGLRD